MVKQMVVYPYSEYYAVTKRNEVMLIYATTWTSSGNIILSGRSQAQKAIHGIISFIRNIQSW